jgi:predicted DNA-binding protein YlxM (UPF0122 family)
MVRKSNIVVFGLESLTRELYNNELSLALIAERLSNECGNKISKTAVHDYLKSDGHFQAEVIKKKAELSLKVVEAEISTIEDRRFFISEMKELVSNTYDERVKVLATEAATKALESLDKRLGHITNNPNVTINNINAMKLSDIPTDELFRMANDASR